MAISPRRCLLGIAIISSALISVIPTSYAQTYYCGGQQASQVNPWASADYVCGSEGNDPSLGGNDGDDDIWGGYGNDTLYGDDGNDELYAGPGGDQLHGNLKNDFLYGGDDSDTLYGGSGTGDYGDGGPAFDSCFDIEHPQNCEAF